MTGIVLWTDSEHAATDAIQLEYSYMKYSDIVSQADTFNWAAVDRLLAQVAGRGHQAILRFYYVYPGQATTVPQYIKANPSYQETRGQSEGLTTWFPDWSHPELQRFTLDFFTRFAARYEHDPRIAFLQVGFGLWAEYHIYDGPMQLGKTFPSKTFQTQFVRHMGAAFTALAWSISIDAADEQVGPFGDDPTLLSLPFGLFDDSFLHKTHNQYNAECFAFFDYETRYRRAPMGGELSYYTDYDQQHALDPQGPYGISFEQLAGRYHISYMIGNDQPEYQSLDRIRKAGLAIGYRFRITHFSASATQSRVTVTNAGIAPLYADAFVAVNGTRGEANLRGLLPGQSLTVLVSSGGTRPTLTIECDRLVAGQTIRYEAALP